MNFATPETDTPLEPSGFLLADTGGHYKEGTTDITRTVVMGPTTEEEKKYFTAVLRGTLNLGAARFLHGCTGVNLDILPEESRMVPEEYPFRVLQNNVQ